MRPILTIAVIVLAVVAGCQSPPPPRPIFGAFRSQIGDIHVTLERELEFHRDGTVVLFETSRAFGLPSPLSRYDGRYECQDEAITVTLPKHWERSLRLHFENGDLVGDGVRYRRR